MNLSRIYFFAFQLFIVSVLLFSCNGKSTVSNGSKLFTRVPSEASGLDFVNELVETVDLNYYVYMDNYVGGGVAAADFNNDGLQDLYFISNTNHDRLYLNEGDLKFKDITESTGIVHIPGFQSGVAVSDINGDGFVDIYISRGGWEEDKFENLLYINNGDLTFTEESVSRGLNDDNRTIHAVFFDYDNDGDLDVYNLNSPDFKKKETELVDLIEAQTYKETFAKKGYDKLFQNDGNGFFKDVSVGAGIMPDIGFGLQPQVADINEDGWPDIYVCNDFRVPDFFYINNGDGTFTDKRNELIKHMSFNSMGADIADINNDGRQDIYTLDMNPDDYMRYITTMGKTPVSLFRKMVEKDYHHQFMHNMLQINNGPNGFSEISNMAGVANTDWSWASLMADFDLDGYNDIFITNGVYRDVIDRDSNREILEMLRKNQRKPTPEDFLQFTQMIPQKKLVNYFFRNRGDLTFEDVSGAWVDSVASFSNGAVYADLDNDGDLDVVYSNLNDKVTLLKNEAFQQNRGNYLKLRFEGTEKNVNGIGVIAKLHFNDNTVQIRELINTRGFISSVSNILHFGIPDTTKVVRLEIIWPDRKTQLIENIKFNQLVNIQYVNATSPTATKHNPQPMFAKRQLDFVHKELFFDDLKLQVLLPHMLSQTGPGFATSDVNGDGLQDIFIGGAYQESGAILLGNSTGDYTRLPQKALEDDKVFEDVGATFFDSDGDGDQDLYVVSGSYEFPPMDPIHQDRLYLNDGDGNFTRDLSALPGISDAGSVVCPADFDNDGDLDLFVGGRVIPGSYPHAPGSYLLINEHGRFEDVTLTSAPSLERIGMVTDAHWVDMDADQDKDLIVTGEWMGIVVFENIGGKLMRSQKYSELGKYVGWWNRLSFNDVDDDGDLDIIAGNLGLNTNFSASFQEPFHVYTGDFDNNGSQDVFLARDYQGLMVPYRGWEAAAQQLPHLNYAFSSFHEYASQDLSGILGPGIEIALHYEATEFRSGIFIREGDEFQFEPFEMAVQQSPVTGIICEDIDGDSISDIILAGNNYLAEPSTTRYDAGIGHFLKGTGDGNFDIMHNTRTGLYMDREVRNIVLIDGKILVINNDDFLVMCKRNL